MRATLAGPGLALTASLALNASFLVQHAGSAALPPITPRRPVATARTLLRSRGWLAGAALGMAGWALHVAALSQAPVSLVQAFVAGGIALAVPMAALGLGHRTTGAERIAVCAMVAALLLLALGLPPDRARAFSAGSLGAVSALGAAAAAGIAARVHGPRRAPALGLAGGILYGIADLATKALTEVGRHGVAEVLTSAWLAVAAAATLGAFFAFQRALQLGRPVAVIALMTAGTNVVAILGGFVVFGDPLGRTGPMIAAHAVAFVLVGVAAFVLAPAQAALVTEEG